MNLELADDERQFRDELRTFLRDNLTPELIATCRSNFMSSNVGSSKARPGCLRPIGPIDRAQHGAPAMARGSSALDAWIVLMSYVDPSLAPQERARVAAP